MTVFSSIPFSRSSPRMCSMISCDIAPPLSARRPGCPGRPGRTGSRRCRRPTDDDGLLAGADDLALEPLALGRAKRDRAADRVAKVLGPANGRSIPGEETRSAYSRRYSRSTSVTRAQSAWSTPSAWSTKTVNRSGLESSTASTSTPGRAVSTSRPICFVSVRSFSCVALKIVAPSTKMGAARPFRPAGENGAGSVASTRPIRPIAGLRGAQRQRPPRRRARPPPGARA